MHTYILLKYLIVSGLNIHYMNIEVWLYKRQCPPIRVLPNPANFFRTDLRRIRQFLLYLYAYACTNTSNKSLMKNHNEKCNCRRE